MFAFGLLHPSACRGLRRFVPGSKSWYLAPGFSAFVFLPFAYAGRKPFFATLAAFTGWVFRNGAMMQIRLDAKDGRSDGGDGGTGAPLRPLSSAREDVPFDESQGKASLRPGRSLAGHLPRARELKTATPVQRAA